jgi:hypothetical protein
LRDAILEGLDGFLDFLVRPGVDLTTHANTLAGGWNGSVIEPGNVDESYLIEQIESGEMPKNEPRLLPAEIRTITEWVAAGAPDN